MLLIFLPTDYRDGIARGVRGTLLRPVLALQRGAVERNAFLEDPAQLRAERDSLAAYLVGQAGVAAENQQLRDLLGLRQRLPPSFVPAEVVRLPGRGSEGYFQLTAGAEQGVTRGASIVAAQGLIGQVREVDASTSFGIDWMNSEFRASAMTIDGETYGILEPRRLDGEYLLVLTGTPRHVQLEPNTLIVTSGHGGVFPRGIPVGTVAGQEGGEAEWQRNYIVRPLVAPSEMTYVLVLGDPQRTLQGQDLASMWGIRPAAPRPATVEGEGVVRGSQPRAPVTTPGTAGAAQPGAVEPEPTQPPEQAAEQPRQQGPRLLGEPVPPQD